MSERVALKIMQCPTCGGSLKAENNTEVITCVYCGNSIVPVAEATQAVQKENVGGSFSGVLKVEGIKTSSSALAYMEQFFEDYDWEAFAYAQNFSVAEIDKLADSLKMSSADDKNTWLVCFKAIYVPYVHKVEGCKHVLDSVIKEYKKDNPDAYSKFDAYKRIAAMIVGAKNTIVEKLEKNVANAAKYGASPEEISQLNSDVEKVKKLIDIEVFSSVESIPEIRTFIDEKNARIADELAAQGIDAKSEYARAKMLIIEKQYVEALNVLLSLNGYLDSPQLIEEIDKYFLISDVLEIEGKLYVFSGSGLLKLYPVVNGRIAKKPLIKKIKKIISNHADVLYYLNKKNKLKKYNLSTNTEEKIYKKKVFDKSIFAYDRRIFILANPKGDYDSQDNNLIELDLITGAVKTILNNVGSVISFTNGKLVYNAYNGFTNIFNVDTLEVTEIRAKNVTIEGFSGNYVVYTQMAPNNYNKNLYIKALASDEAEKLIEPNIFSFCTCIAGKLFYYVGNSRNKSLININRDGTGRREWPLYISTVLFEQGGWIYFIRKAGYNSILCRARIDGSKFSVIAADIEEFIEIKNGYLYYINFDSALVKVRMDGSNLQELCDDVEKVLAVKEDKIIFISIDDRIKNDDKNIVAFTKLVKSIYAVDFSGGGKIKLAYDIGEAKKYDENTVYFFAAKRISSSYDSADDGCKILYSMDVETNATQALFEIDSEKSGCYVATCVYGSYDCPEVWTLRRFRDDVLASTWYGRAFIHLYYAISPTIVKWFGHTEWFKNMWQGKLDRMVENLQSQGVESTPYQDKNWK